MKSFKLYFDTHRSDNLVAEIELTIDGIKTNYWYEQVFIFVPTATYYYGKGSKQPKFVIGGRYNSLEIDGLVLTII